MASSVEPVRRAGVPVRFCREHCHAWAEQDFRRNGDGCHGNLFDAARREFCLWSAEELKAGRAPGKRYWKE